jgi:hypothetical protein
MLKRSKKKVLKMSKPLSIFKCNIRVRHSIFKYLKGQTPGVFLPLRHYMCDFFSEAQSVEEEGNLTISAIFTL